MAEVIGLKDVANAVTYIVPGYFAYKTYAAIYAHENKKAPDLLVESIVFSLPIVVLSNIIWGSLLHQPTPASTSSRYLLLVLTIAITAGYLVAQLQKLTLMMQVTEKLGLENPDNDFLRSRFRRLKAGDAVTVTLKNGEIFSGTPKRGQMHSAAGGRQYYFNNLAWYDKSNNTWTSRSGGVIVDIQDVQYIESATDIG